MKSIDDTDSELELLSDISSQHSEVFHDSETGVGSDAHLERIKELGQVYEANMNKLKNIIKKSASLTPKLIDNLVRAVASASIQYKSTIESISSSKHTTFNRKIKLLDRIFDEMSQESARYSVLRIMNILTKGCIRRENCLLCQRGHDFHQVRKANDR